MAHVDYESAWVELMAYVASKTGHGRDDLLTEMAQIAKRHHVREDLLQQALRLYGGSLTIQTIPETDASGADRALTAAAKLPDHGPSSEGGHDERDARAGHEDDAGAGRPSAGRRPAAVG
jgi:hypothetical protein